MTFLKATKRGSPGNIYTDEISNYMAGSQKYSEVAYLEKMSDKIKSGGRFILASCFGGKGVEGIRFSRAIAALTGNRLNIFYQRTL